MDLGLDILRVNGRQEVPLTPTFVRVLNDSDIALLSVERGVQKTPSTVKRLSERHHGLARALASGMKHYQAAQMFGYHSHRVTILLNDPSFKELVIFYREHKDAEFRQVQKMMAGDLVDFVDSAHDDLIEGKMSPGQKLEFIKGYADRTGLGPATTANHNHVHTVNVADRLNAARKRLSERPMVDITPEAEDAA